MQCVQSLVSLVWSGVVWWRESGARRGSGSSGSSSNEWWWCGGGYDIILDIRLYNNNYYNKGCVGCGGVRLWIRTNFTRFTLKVLCFSYI